MIIFLYFTIVLSIHFLVFYFFNRKEKWTKKQLFLNWVKKRLRDSLFAISVVITLILYLAYINPARITTRGIEIPDIHKKIVFQEMIHLGSPEFYKKIKSQTKALSEKGFVTYYEEVNGRVPIKELKVIQDDRKIDLNSKSLSLIDKLIISSTLKREELLNYLKEKKINVALQNNCNLIEGIRTRNTDLSEMELKDTNWKPYLVREMDIINECKNKIPDSINDSQFSVGGILTKAAISFVTKLSSGTFNELLQVAVGGEGQTKELIHQMLDKRNSMIVFNIENSKDKLINILFGKVHFDGVVKELRKKWPNIKVVKIGETNI